MSTKRPVGRSTAGHSPLATSSTPAVHLTPAIPANPELAEQLATRTSAARSPASSTRLWCPRQLGCLDSPQTTPQILPPLAVARLIGQSWPPFLAVSQIFF
jgi:hypothetical protein